ncbi:MAG: CvpA family protein, partial [Candidatus Omnitrophota bacterium]
FMDFITFIFLIILGYLCFVVLRSVFSRFIQLNAVPKISQCLGLILGMGRGLLVIGLLSFTLVISNVNYLNNSVKHSYLGSKAFIILPQTYGWLWNNIFSKFSAHEKFNPAVTQVMEKFNHK